MSRKTVLFLCTGNCCRSPLAEAILRHVGDERFEACSAGSNPAGYVHPLTLATLDVMGICHDGLDSKSWNEYSDRRVDLVITVCDLAARETCPVFPGLGLKVHWPLPDPSRFPGTDQEQMDMCLRLGQRLKLKLERMTALDFDSLPAETLRRELEALADL